MKKILIVEDDKKIAQLEQVYLEMSGYETTCVYDGAIVEETVRNGSYDLILLDIMLPNCNGYTICERLRKETEIPILMVTAMGESLDIIRGLGLGADDYITKPFDPAQLVARVKAHLTRYERLVGKESRKENVSGTEQKIEIRNICIYPESWKVYVDDKEIRLPNKEFELLLFLAKHSNIVFSREQLFEKIWGYEYDSDAATVSVHINRIREKIEKDPKNPQIIDTIWGVGYRLNA
ncbi:MAG: response regulator transcription factor [Lachnospiraceae bacterium]|nr:response regulator transcription factor [Lachnospiraceae bacterium]